MLVQPFLQGRSEGHVVMVTRPNQLVLQSEPTNGVNEYKSAESQHAYTPFAWAGWLPGCPAADWLPGWGSGGVDGYPGDWADPVEVAAWMSRVAERIYGIPGILPVMTSCVELTDAWTGPGDLKGVTGYLEPHDHWSVGYFQQQYDGNPAGEVFGWGTYQQLINPEFALSRFLDVALEQASLGEYPTDAQGLGEWCQRVQNSGVPDAYRDKGYEMAKDLLGDTSSTNNGTTQVGPSYVGVTANGTLKGNSEDATNGWWDLPGWEWNARRWTKEKGYF